MTDASVEAVYRGPGCDPSPPALPAGWGAIEVQYHFSRQGADGTRAAFAAAALRNIWIPPPALLVDGSPRQASWSTWWYPVPAGQHEVEVREPGQAATPVQVPAGQVLRLTYAAEIVVGAPGAGPGTEHGQDVMIQEPGGLAPYSERLSWHAVGRLS